MTKRHKFRNTSVPAGDSFNVGNGLRTATVCLLLVVICPGHAQDRQELEPTPGPGRLTSQATQMSQPTPAAGAPTAASADELSKKAERLFNRREYLECGKVCEELARHHLGTKQAARAALLVARMYEALGERGKALEAYESIAALGPNAHGSAYARERLPMLLIQAGRQREAIDMAKAAAEAEPTDYMRANAYFCTAHLAMRVDVAEAIACFNKVIQEYPDTPFASMAKTALKRMSERMLSEIEDMD